jgi:hypothetical protein
MAIGSLRKNHTYRQRNMVVLLKKQERGGSDMKIYVILKYRPLGNEEYIGIKKSRKEAEKCLRQLFPHMRVMNDTLVSDANGTYVLEVREEEV